MRHPDAHRELDPTTSRLCKRLQPTYEWRHESRDTACSADLQNQRSPTDANTNVGSRKSQPLGQPA